MVYSSAFDGYDPSQLLGDVDPDWSPRIGTHFPSGVARAKAGDQNKGRMVFGPPQPVYGAPRFTEADARGIYNMTPQHVRQTQISLARAGFLDSIIPGDKYSTYSAYRTAMAAANLEGKPLGEFLRERAQRLGQVASGVGSSGYGGGGGGGSSSYTATSTSSSTQNMVTRSINLTGRGQAESLLRNALLQELGRIPTNKEVSQFKRLLNTAERKSPTVTKSSQKSSTTTTTHVSGQNQSSSSSTSGSGTSTTKQSDVDPGEEALDYAQSKPLRRERKMYQDLGYYNAIAEMLGM